MTQNLKEISSFPYLYLEVEGAKNSRIRIHPSYTTVLIKIVECILKCFNLIKESSIREVEISKKKYTINAASYQQFCRDNNVDASREDVEKEITLAAIKSQGPSLEEAERRANLEHEVASRAILQDGVAEPTRGPELERKAAAAAGVAVAAVEPDPLDSLDASLRKEYDELWAANKELHKKLMETIHPETFTILWEEFHACIDRLIKNEEARSQTIGMASLELLTNKGPANRVLAQTMDLLLDRLSHEMHKLLKALQLFAIFAKHFPEGDEKQRICQFIHSMLLGLGSEEVSKILEDQLKEEIDGDPTKGLLTLSVEAIKKLPWGPEISAYYSLMRTAIAPRHFVVKKVFEIRRMVLEPALQELLRQILTRTGAVAAE